VSLDKAIKHGKEHRKPYFRSGRFDRTCRPGGSCPYCRNNPQAPERTWPPGEEQGNP
jgi:hypothetical protein